MRILHKLFLAILIIAPALPVTEGNTASLREVIRTCGNDGKKYCKNVRYGKPMQSCLSQNKKKLTLQCNALMKRLDAGEKVTLF